jgi:hypothetical protein
MKALAAQIAAMQHQLTVAMGSFQQQLSKLATQQSAVLATQSTHTATLATHTVALAILTAPAVVEGVQQEVRHKRQRALSDNSTSPLDKDVILDLVFGYVGLGDYFYTAAVCRSWRGRYITLCKSATSPKTHKLYTSYRSAITTAARLELALDSNLQIADLQSDSRHFAWTVVFLSLEARSVLALARGHGLQWSGCLTYVAALKNEFELVRWLYESGCPTHFPDVITFAIKFDRADILAWVRSLAGVRWYAGFLNDSLVEAGRAGSVAAAAWLRTQGAEWPASFVTWGRFSMPQGSYVCWRWNTVKWALANGCTWGDWECRAATREHCHCDDCGRNRSHGRERCSKGHARELLEWAHNNGCPCTCRALVVWQQQ